MTVAVQPVTPDRWDDLVAFFGPNGAYSNCWCAWFRVRAKDYDGPANRRLLQRLTREGAVPGLLGYDGGGPVGWVSMAPREQFERILRSRAIGPAQPDELGVWSLVCFWIPAPHRRKGVGTALLDGAVAYARSQHAAVVEAYPVDTVGEKRPGAELFTGTVTMFQRAGFTITRHARSGRPIARLTV
ncbi:MAG: GNAT family N-acetyltransferase [Jiangellaceae bacterium]|nr:GNAT family N-acetyltransferase [Jiangellaceae bacterium]